MLPSRKATGSRRPPGRVRAVGGTHFTMSLQATSRAVALHVRATIVCMHAVVQWTVALQDAGRGEAFLPVGDPCNQPADEPQS